MYGLLKVMSLTHDLLLSDNDVSHPFHTPESHDPTRLCEFYTNTVQLGWLSMMAVYSYT